MTLVNLYLIESFLSENLLLNKALLANISLQVGALGGQYRGYQQYR